MNSKLKTIMQNELKSLKILLKKLEEQYNLLTATKKDVVEISRLAEEIDMVIKEIATLELEKKNILKERTLSSIVENSNDNEAKEIYTETLKLLDAVTMQKSTNHLFVKQQLFFTKSLIKAITPNRNAEVYDSYGKIRK